MKNKRIQPYLSPVHIDVLDRFINERFDSSEIKYEEAIKYLILEYDQLKREKQKLNYIDQNTTIILNLVSSMMAEMNLQQRPLEESIAYFDAKKYVDSLLNNPRTVRPSHKIQSKFNHITTKVSDDFLIEEETQPSIFNQTNSSNSFFDSENEPENELVKNSQKIKEMFDTLKE